MDRFKKVKKKKMIALSAISKENLKILNIRYS